ncbi:MAG TPA: FtsX-like permease family protein [Candidatus Sulfotelmatobacter sp.]|nr:FtsX-like permease family protein [Candidatus Sulfotelmatobacter sp.]
MHTFTLVSKNLSRRKGRAIISSIGLILAIAVIVSTFTVSAAMQAQVGNEIDKYGPNIIVTPNTQSINVPYGNVIIGKVTFSEDSLDKILTIPNKANVRVLSPKLYNQIQYGNNTILIVGSFANKEAELKKWWNVTGSLPQNDTDEILVGSNLKTSLNLQIGSSIQLNNSSFLVTGALAETGSVDDYSIFMPLHTAQELFNLQGKISEVDVGALCNTCPVEKIAEQIMTAVPDIKAIPIKQAVETRMQAVQATANFSLLLASIILVVGIAGITNTMLASVHERIKEIGVFMSLGADNTHLYKMFLSESTILGLIGGLIGTLVGVFASFIMGPLLINIPINIAEMPLYVIPLAIGLSVIASVAASLYPTWRASKIDPVKALKAV